MVVTREQWGARHDDGSGPAPEPASEVWLHHTVARRPGLTVESEISAMRELEEIGEQRFGRGISYNRVPMPSGRMYEGVSWNRRGAHVARRNSIARSYALPGNYDTHDVTTEQIEAIARDMVDAWRKGHLLQPRLTGGHGDAPGASTACPGRYGRAAIPLINARALQLRNLPTGKEDWMSALNDSQQRELYNATLQTRDIAGGARGAAQQAQRDSAAALARVKALEAAVARLQQGAAPTAADIAQELLKAVLTRGST